MKNTFNDKKLRDEFNLRMATCLMIQGSLFAGMEMDEIVDIIKDTADEHQKEYERQLTLED